MSNTGTMQHPEVHCLEVEEYDEFIADPYKCMVEKLMPRLFAALDTEPMRCLLYTSACSMDMAGMSVTLCKLDDELKELLDYPCDTPYFTQVK